MSVATRLALRELAAHKARSWLIVILVALPVLVASGTSVWFATAQLTPERAAARSMGRAAATVTAGYTADATVQEAFAQAASRLDGVVEAEGLVQGRVDGATTELGLVVVEATHPLLAGRWLVDGDTDDERVLLSRALLDSLGLRVGEHIELAGRPYRVGGTFGGGPEVWQGLRGVVVAPGHPLAVHAEPATLFLEHAPEPGESTALTDAGLVVFASSDEVATATLSSLAAQETLIGIVGTGLGSLVVAAVSAAAFAIAIRQMRRTLALLAATGAPPRVLSGILVRCGLVLGVGGALLGCLLGVAAASAAAWWGQWQDPQPGFGIVVCWTALASFVALGILAALVAVWLPSRGVARQDALAALAESERAMPQPGVPWLALVPAGLGTILLGVAIWRAEAGAARFDGTETAWLLGGSAGTMVLWFAACVLASPWIVERLAAWAPRAWRLALRDTARVGRRSVALVAASASVVALGAWSVTYVTAYGNREVADHVVGGPVGVARVGLDAEMQAPTFASAASRVQAVESAVGRAAMVAEVSSGDRLTGSGYEFWSVAPTVDDYGTLPAVLVGDERLLGLLLGQEPPGDLVDALDQGRALVFDPALVADGVVEFDRHGEQDAERFALPGTLAPTVAGAGALISPETAESLGMEVRPSAVWLRFGEPLDERSIAQARDVVNALGGHFTFDYEQGPHSPSHRILPVLVLVMGALAAGVAVVGMALALNDGRETRISLATIGATTPQLRRLAVAQSVVCVALGGAVGLLAGIAPVAIALSTSTIGMGALPWSLLAALVLGPVAAAALGAAAVVRPVDPRPVQAARAA